MALLRGARCAVFAASAAAPASAACATGRTSAGAAAPAHRLRRALSSTALVPVSPPSAGPASAPYTITEAPAPADGGARRPKWGRFVLKSIGGHTKKLNPIARQIVGLSVNEALAQMAFLAKRRGRAVGSAVERAAWNADFHHDVRREDLLVDAAWTGKQFTQPRIRYHSKGRAGRAHMRTSMFTVKLREMTAEERVARQKFPWRATDATRAKLDPRGY